MSPELAGLLRRLKTIYAITGGAPEAPGKEKNDFNAKKSALIAQLHAFDKLIDARDHSGLATDGRDYIRLKTQIGAELKRLEESVRDLAEVHKKEMTKRGAKMGADEVLARKEVIESVVLEFQSAYKAAKGFSHAGAEENLGAGVGMRALTTDALMKGQFDGAGIKTRKQEMTGDQLQKLEAVRAQNREQDAVLDEISKGLDELQDLAEKMGDELQLQDKMLGDLDSKADKTQGKVDAVNDRMKDVLAKVNDKSSNACVYLICVIILLAMASVVYNMATTKK